MPESRCQNCGTPLEGGVLDGLCPACLWAGLLEDEDTERKGQMEAPTIPGHEVFEEIGQGGMGLVYRARQQHPAREVALKIIAPYSLRANEARQRFIMEVEAMAAIEHPAVLPLYQSGEDEFNRPWLTMQLLRGGNLAENIKRYFGDWKGVVTLLRKLCDAIGHAHERGILHRDLKPANILFDEEGNPYVADFGLAKWADEDGGLSKTSCLLGSPAYLAPEAAEGGSKLTTTVSDVYGLGAILYELLTGTSPYRGESPNEILTKIISGSPAPPRKITNRIPRDLETIVLKAMAREPRQRYHSVLALSDDLGRWAEGRPILASPPNVAERLWLWSKRNPAAAALAFLLLACLVAGGALLTTQNIRLNVALDDAENRVDFMVRELPAELAPIGRLEVLDRVFEDVAEHYQNPVRRGTESLARHADFQTQWSQILRPRALTDEAREHLEQALALAEEAYREGGGRPSLEVVRARSLAGWRLAEVLIEDEEFEKAESILRETESFLGDHRGLFPNDFHLAHIEAAIGLEKIILLTKTERAQAALSLVPETEKRWQSLRSLMDMPETEERSSVLVEAARVPYFIYLIHLELGNPAECELALGRYLERTRELLDRDETDLTFVAEYFSALLFQGTFFLNEERGNEEVIVAGLTEADRRSQQIYAQDPGNIKWSSHSVHLAKTLARLAKKRGDEAAANRWVTTLSERLHRLYRLPSNELDALRAICDAGIYCFENRGKNDWTWTREHHVQVIDIQIAICRQTGEIKSFHNLRRLIRIFVDDLAENEGSVGALNWLEILITTRLEETHRSARADQVGWWHLITAFAWGQRDRLGEEGARKKANREMLQALDEAGQLLVFPLLRPQNRKELFDNLLRASTDRGPETTLERDEKLAAILSAGLLQLEKNEQPDALTRLRQAHQDDEGVFRKGYEALEELTIPQE